VARDAANEAGHSVIKLDLRDVDVPLSDLGHLQAEAAGRWFAALPDNEKPEILLSSPYIRARQTAEAICNAGGLAGGAKPTITDERLREREFGIFDGLTSRGIREQFPTEASHRTKMGKFYHRPPGGESWADVILRLRSVMNTINLHYADHRVLVVCHQVVVLCMRYILEELSEGQILAIDKQAEILNCGICAYDFTFDESGLCSPKLDLWNVGAPMEAEGTPQTAEPDAMAGSR
jgi:probable phosphoglycerate mutase